jgi:hypothetical protein
MVSTIDMRCIPLSRPFFLRKKWLISTYEWLLADRFVEFEQPSIAA